ncbi:MAG: Diaminopimelate epimerase [Deltaproteobacteria bacterium]|jgi:diaminopimelate epimerase|nr:Diaminopimelate epimerase [Deltaproteobacteria bacterium]
MKFIKYHALGNDYLVLNSENPDLQKTSLTTIQVRKICHRNFGLGSDGILVGNKDKSGKHFNLQIFNPDGSTAEKSGNGLRIFARFLWDKKLVNQSPFQIKTSGGLVTAVVDSPGTNVSVEMGTVSFQSAKIPVAGKSREVLNETIDIDGQQLSFCASTIGNPHCVVLNGVQTETEVRRLGPLIETHPNFPNRINVQFLEVLNRGTIRIKIWERGAGYTLASGSSSCAAASVVHKLGLCDNQIEVHMPGGHLDITVSEDYSITMRGAVTRVGEMSIESECFDFEMPV